VGSTSIRVEPTKDCIGPAFALGSHDRPFARAKSTAQFATRPATSPIDDNPKVTLH